VRLYDFLRFMCRPINIVSRSNSRAAAPLLMSLVDYYQRPPDAGEIPSLGAIEIFVFNED